MTPALTEHLRPEKYLERWAEGVQRQKALRESTDSSALIFRLGKEMLALPTSAVPEILERRTIHSVPHRRGGILLGLANCRGELLTCVSVSALLGIATAAQIRDPGGESSPPGDGGGLRYPGATAREKGCADRMIVLNWRDSRLGFPVDEVHGTVRFRMAALQSPPAALQAGQACILGLLDWEGKVVTFLDADRLMALLTENLA